jgi:phospholipase C
MSEQASSDEKSKARIITHMNQDHHDSVRFIDIQQPVIAINKTSHRSSVISNTTTIFLATKHTQAKSQMPLSTTLRLSAPA